MRFRLFGTEIILSFPFCAVICLALYTDRTGIVVPTLLAAALHETGHLFTLWVYDCPPVKIELVPAGVRITRQLLSAKENSIVTALSGPLFNLAVAFCAGLNFTLYKSRFILYCFAANLALGVFNLLPSFGLDGGTVLLNLLEKATDYKRAQNITRAVSFLTVLSFAAAGVYFYIKVMFNPSVFIAAAYLLFCAVCVVRE